MIKIRPRFENAYSIISQEGGKLLLGDAFGHNIVSCLISKGVCDIAQFSLKEIYKIKNGVNPAYNPANIFESIAFLTRKIFKKTK